MKSRQQIRCTAFVGWRRIASGDLLQVALETKEVLDRGTHEPVLIFDDRTSELIEVDFRGTASDLRKRITHATEGGMETEADLVKKDLPRGPGRPKLGVVAREVTLLPRHWDWLNCQPGGASVALRRLVEEARKLNKGKDRIRQSQESAYRFMTAIAGNGAGYEEAIRALFAGKADEFEHAVESWPADIRDHAQKLAAIALRRSICDSNLTSDVSESSS